MNAQAIELLTFFFLVGFFAFLEIRQLFDKERGIIVDFVEPALPLAGMLSTEVLVRMEDGNIVNANLSGCTQCMGRFQVGDEVHLIRSRSGYSVKIPFISRKRDHICERQHSKRTF